MAVAHQKWLFTKAQLENTPSRKCGIDADKELAYRQQAANLIQDIGQKLHLSQLCINTAVLYMHRFYQYHPFTIFHRSALSAAALFLAAKVTYEPRAMEYVIKAAHFCLHRGDKFTALTSEQYLELTQDLILNENVLLQTLGFNVNIKHPHKYVVDACHLIKAPKDLAHTAYAMASNCLHITTMCLQYPPTVIACFCIYLTSKWSNWQIPLSNEGRPWFSYVDRSISASLLDSITTEFLEVFDRCPTKLRQKMMTMCYSGSPSVLKVTQEVSTPSTSTSCKSVKKQATNSNEHSKNTNDKDDLPERRQQMPGKDAPTTITPVSQQHETDHNVVRENKKKEEMQCRVEITRLQLPSSSKLQIPVNHQGILTYHSKPPIKTTHIKPLEEELGKSAVITNLNFNKPENLTTKRLPSIFSPEHSTPSTAVSSKIIHSAVQKAPHLEIKSHNTKEKSLKQSNKKALTARRARPPTDTFSSTGCKHTVPRQRKKQQAISKPVLASVVRKLNDNCVTKSVNAMHSNKKGMGSQPKNVLITGEKFTPVSHGLKESEPFVNEMTKIERSYELDMSNPEMKIEDTTQHKKNKHKHKHHNKSKKKKQKNDRMTESAPFADLEDGNKNIILNELTSQTKIAPSNVASSANLGLKIRISKEALDPPCIRKCTAEQYGPPPKIARH